jgi:hypothetical protein
MQTSHKKEYDRLRAEKIYNDFKKRKVLIMEILGGKCFLCDKKAEKGFHLHHKEYHPIESNYPKNSKSMHVRLKRIIEAEKNPNRFSLLCPKCHLLVEAFKINKIDIEKLKTLY